MPKTIQSEYKPVRRKSFSSRMMFQTSDACESGQTK